MIYEVRTYSLQPGTVAEFESRFAKRHPFREKHSKLGAFWHPEVGPLNQVIHVWPYEDLQHRAAVRAAKQGRRVPSPSAAGSARSSRFPVGRLVDP